MTEKILCDLLETASRAVSRMNVRPINIITPKQYASAKDLKEIQQIASDDRIKLTNQKSTIIKPHKKYSWPRIK